MLELEAVPPGPTRAETLDGFARRIDAALAAEDWSDAQRSFEEAWTRVRDGGGERLLLAAEPAAGRPTELSARLGLVPVRELLQLRRPLPHEQHATVAVRSFVPGQDDDHWLAVNNRAFAWHPDQRDWTRTHLHQRMAEPWFDPDGFLLHERDGRLAAFCWTKVHTDADPPLGEIYVIGVDPDAQGLGLGRQLTLAGLDRLAAHGIGTAMLYVEADNTAARRLYDDLGFAVHHTKRWWARERSDEREG